MIWAICIEGAMIALLVAGFVHARGVALIAHLRLNDLQAFVLDLSKRVSPEPQKMFEVKTSDYGVATHAVEIQVSKGQGG